MISTKVIILLTIAIVFFVIACLFLGGRLDGGISVIGFNAQKLAAHPKATAIRTAKAISVFLAAAFLIVAAFGKDLFIVLALASLVLADVVMVLLIRQK